MAMTTAAGVFNITPPGSTFSADYPPGKWHPAAMNATRRLPSGLTHALPIGPAVYGFEFHLTPLEWYVGETDDFRSRMCDYSEMTRLLLALRTFNGQVTIQKHSFRKVQMALADAALAGTRVTLSYRTLPPGCSKGFRLAEEALERAAMRTPGTVEINDGPSLEQMPTSALAPQWVGIQARVRRRNLV